MQISCGLVPSLDVVEHAKLAEEIGYERAWLYDSPAIYLDIWVALARIAGRRAPVLSGSRRGAGEHTGQSALLELLGRGAGCVVWVLGEEPAHQPEHCQ